jgi:hypothetical protein
MPCALGHSPLLLFYIKKAARLSKSFVLFLVIDPFTYAASLPPLASISFSL